MRTYSQFLEDLEQRKVELAQRKQATDGKNEATECSNCI